MYKLFTEPKIVLVRAFSIMLICALLAGHTPLARAAIYSVNVHPLLLKMAAEDPNEMARIIVQEHSSDADTESLVYEYGGTVVQDLRIINGYVAEMPAHAVPKLGMNEQIRWISLDIEVVETGQLSASQPLIRDQFLDTAFTGSTGSHNWTGPWSEIGEADGPELGNVTVSRFLGGTKQGLRIQQPDNGALRSADLSEATSATLSFTYRRKSFDSTSDIIRIEISADGGMNWTELGQLTGPAVDDSVVAAHYDITDFTSTDTAVRFVSGNALNDRAKFYLDDIEFAYTTTAQGTNRQNDLFLPVINNPGFQLPDRLPTQNVQAASNNPNSCNLLIDGDFENGLASWTLDNAGEVISNAYSGQNAVRIGGATASTLSQVVFAATVGETYHFSGMFQHLGGSQWIGLGIDFWDANWNEIGEVYTPIQASDSYKPTMLTGVAPPGSVYLSLWIYNSGGGYLSIDDVELASATMLSTYPCASGFTIRDGFDDISFAGSEGSQSWGDTWQELGESNGAATGDVRVVDDEQCASGNCLAIGGESNGTRGLMRSMDLGGATNATLIFNWRRHYSDNGVEDDGYSSDRPFKVKISSDNGVTWTTIHEIESGFDTVQRTERLDISAFVSSETVLRYTTDSAQWFDGYVYIDNIEIAHDGVGGTVDTNSIGSTYAKAIGADQLWNAPNYIRGTDVTVAVVDSGLAMHGDFNQGVGYSRIIGQVDFTGGSGTIDDYYGHGTHVAGAIGGNGHHSDGSYIGVAPGVNLIDVKVTDDYGTGTMSSAIAGLQWILENRETYNIRVANLSLNSTVAESYHSSPLSAALEILWFNNIVVVVSAGNNGNSNQGVVYPPANDPFVITIGSADDLGTPGINDDQLSTFSAYGTTIEGHSKPDLIVPGANIIAALASDDSNLALEHPAHTVGGPAGNYYFRMSGTSMASGVAAGAVALLLQDEPNLTPDQVKYRLMTTAQTFPGPVTGSTGAGYLDIYAAVHATTTASANTNLAASELLWSGEEPIMWNSVNWNSVNWNSVNWNSVNWNSVNWNSVNWNSVSWDD